MLKQLVLKSLKWTTLTQIVSQLMAFLVLAILARFVSPGDFGLLSMVMVFLSFAKLFMKLGFGQALIQKMDITQDHYSTVFWTNVFLGLLLTLIMCLLAPLISKFYGETRLIELTVVSSLAFIIASLNVVQIALLQRQFDFKSMTYIKVFGALVGNILAVISALSGAGVWSLVIQDLSTTVFEVIIAWTITKWRPLMVFRISALRDLMRFTAHFSIYTFIEYWTRNADNMLVGKVLGTEALGFYGRSYNISTLLIEHLFNITYPVAYSMFSKIQTDLSSIRLAYQKMLTLMSMLVFPMMLGLMILASPIISILLGPRWLFATPILQLLCIVALVRGITEPGKWVLQSLGRVDVILRWQLIKTPIIVFGFVAGVSTMDIIKFTQLYLVVSIVLSVPELIVVCFITKLNIGKVFKKLFVPLFSAVLMTVVVFYADKFFFSAYNDILKLLVEAAIGCICYLFLLTPFVLRDKEVRANLRGFILQPTSYSNVG